MTKMIQSMPGIWNNDIFLTSKEDVLGALANWAVKQSPYVFPDDLIDGLRQFNEQFSVQSITIMVAGGFFKTNCEELLKMIRKTFERCPTIMAWNESKKGDVEIAFVSRYDKPEPDFDFIDLDALARNIAHSVTLAEKYNQLHN